MNKKSESLREESSWVISSWKHKRISSILSLIPIDQGAVRKVIAFSSIMKILRKKFDSRHKNLAKWILSFRIISSIPKGSMWLWKGRSQISPKNSKILQTLSRISLLIWIMSRIAKNNPTPMPIMKKVISRRLKGQIKLSSDKKSRTDLQLWKTKG